MKLNACYSYFILIVILLSGCAPSSPTIVPILTETPFLSPTTLSPLSTKTPVPIATLTPPATLNFNEAANSMATLLKESIDCQAPCFWGITPGQSTLGEAQNIFTRFRLLMENTTKVGDFEFYDVDHNFSNNLSISILLIAQNDLVKGLTVDISPETQKVGRQKEWSAYSPETLINQYGVPSKINFDVDRGMSPGYGIAMFFDAVDLIAYYRSDSLGAGLRVCPLLDHVDYIRLWMGENPRHPPANDRIPLDEATSLTMEEFANLMTGGPAKACFTLNRNAFP